MLVFGFLTYASVFMTWSLLSTYGLSAGWSAQLVGHVVEVIAILAASRIVDIADFRTAITYGAAWAVVHFLLDLLYVVPLVGFSPFFGIYGWISYGVIFVTPFLFLLWHKVRGSKNAQQDPQNAAV